MSNKMKMTAGRPAAFKAKAHATKSRRAGPMTAAEAKATGSWLDWEPGPVLTISRAEMAAMVRDMRAIAGADTPAGGDWRAAGRRHLTGTDLVHVLVDGRLHLPAAAHAVLVESLVQAGAIDIDPERLLRRLVPPDLLPEIARLLEVELAGRQGAAAATTIASALMEREIRRLMLDTGGAGQAAGAGRQAA